jgi:8-oxo-dGTP diphosphatase
MGKRIGWHGGGKYALPGGHLELGESWQLCAHRETLEETNLNLDMSLFRFMHVTNDANMNGDPNKHYVTIFMHTLIPLLDTQAIVNNEPQKCEGWEWMAWSHVHELARLSPDKLFEPMIHLVQEFDVEKSNLFEYD